MKLLVPIGTEVFIQSRGYSYNDLYEGLDRLPMVYTKNLCVLDTTKVHTNPQTGIKQMSYPIAYDIFTDHNTKDSYIKVIYDITREHPVLGTVYAWYVRFKDCLPQS